MAQAVASALATTQLQRLLDPTAPHQRRASLAGNAAAVLLAAALCMLCSLFQAWFLRCGLQGLCLLRAALDGDTTTNGPAMCGGSTASGPSAVALWAAVATEWAGIWAFVCLAAIDLAERRHPGKTWTLQLLRLDRQSAAWLLLRLQAGAFATAATVLLTAAVVVGGGSACERLLWGGS